MQVIGGNVINKYKIKKDITIRFIPNLLEDKGRTLQSFSYNRTWTIRRYLKKSKVYFKDMRIIVNGNEIKSLRQHLQSGDEIVVAPNVEWPAVVAVGKWFIEHWVTYTLLAISAATTIYSVYTALTYKPKKASFGTIGYGTDEASPSASWTGTKTMREPGGSVPIIYGRRLTGGTVINEYITTDGDKNYLNSLVAIGEGKFRSITLKRINRNPAENFSNYSVETRLGTNDQTVIPNFEDLHNIHSLNVPLTKNNPYVYTTEASDVEAFEIRFNLPSGLFQQDSSGNILSWDVTYKVEYRIHPTPPDDPPYIDLGSTTISAKSRSEVRRTFRKVGLTAGQYDIKITKTSDDSSLDPMKNGDLYLVGVDEINTDDLEYPNTGLAGIRALATEQLSGDSPEYEFEAEREILCPKVMNGAVEVDWEDYYWDPTGEGCYKLLVGDTPLTMDGYAERFSANPIWCSYDLMTKTRYGIGNYITTDDHDLDYLLEISQHCEERVPDGEGGWEKRFRMDICIDSPQKALALIMQLSTIFRGLPFYSDNGKIRIAIDKPDTPVQLFGMGNIVEDSFSQTWTSKRDIPNIVYVQYDNKDNYYQQEKIEVNDPESLAAGKPINPKEVRYYGTKLSYAIRYGRNLIKTAKYIGRTITIKGGSGALVRQCGEVVEIAHDVPQWGFSGIVKTGTIWKGNYNNETSYFINDVVFYEGESYRCIQNSVGNLPTNTDYWTVMSRTKVKLDREVVIEETKSYAIRVDFAQPNEDGSPRYEERYITAETPPGTYMEVNVTEVFSMAPQEFDIYSFGPVDKVVFPARIMSLVRQRTGEVEMQLQEYNENIFDDSAVVIPERKISSLQLDIPNVQNLELTERLVKLKDGTIENVIDVWFRRPDLVDYYIKRYAKAKIFLSDNDGASWIYRGETYLEHFAIQGDIKDLQTYKIAVVSVSDKGEEKVIGDSSQEEITVLGKTAKPAKVTGFDVYQQGNMLYLTCDIHPDIDFAYFRVKQGTDWNYGKIVIERADLNKFPYPVGEIGTLTFMIKAVDTSENESAGVTYDTLVVVPPPEMSFINAFDLWSVPLEYKRSNMDLVWDSQHNKNFNRIMLALKTAKTWEDLEAEAQTWEWQEENDGLILDKEFESSGYFEMIKPLDLQTKFPFKIIIDASYWAGLNCALTIQISISDDDINYSSFETIDANKLYTARYIKFKVIIVNTDIAYNLYLYDCTIWVNAPTVKKAWGQDIAIPIEGKIIIFGVDFILPPRFMAIVSNGIAGYVSWAKEDLTKDQNKVFVKNFSGVAVGTGEINYEASGM